MGDKGQGKFQIGKEGLNKGALESLQNYFKTHKIVRVSVSKNLERNKKKIKEMADQIVSSLEGNYNYRIIGFTIVMKKVSKTRSNTYKP